MKKYAEILSKGLPEARIDFYDINGKVYFGEITFFHWSGFERFEPAEWDDYWEKWSGSAGYSELPYGGELSRQETNNNSYTVRLQLNANKYFGTEANILG